MRFLIDTHAFLWFAQGDLKLPSKCRNLLEDSRNDRILSHVSLWEISIKNSVGKLRLDLPIRDFFRKEIAERQFVTLPITEEDVLLVSELALHHRDPFDRLLVTQCLANALPIMSGDSTFDEYGVTRIWS